MRNTFNIVSRFTNRNKFSAQSKSNNDVEEESNDSEPQQEAVDEIREGALELFENIFGENLEDKKLYSKRELLDLAHLSSNESSRARSGSKSSNNSSIMGSKLDPSVDRVFLIKELLDNIYSTASVLDKSQIIKEIYEQIKHDRFFNDDVSNSNGSQVSGNVLFDGIKAIKSDSNLS